MKALQFRVDRERWKKGHRQGTFSCLIALLNSNSKCYHVCFVKTIRKIGKGGWHHYPLAFKKKKGSLLFARIESSLLPVSINLANGRIAAPWKSIDQYASWRRQWRRSWWWLTASLCLGDVLRGGEGDCYRYLFSVE